MAEIAKTVEAHEAMKMQVKKVKRDAHLAGSSSPRHSFIRSTQGPLPRVTHSFIRSTQEARLTVLLACFCIYTVNYWL